MIPGQSREETATTTPASQDPRYRDMPGLFLVPVLVALVQSWASFRIIQQVTAGSITDGILYVSQARWFQASHLPKKIYYFFEFGLYPGFLSWFDFVGLSDWSTSTTNSKILLVYTDQSLLLSASTALFLFLSFLLIPGNVFKRTIVSALLGLLLLSPLFVVWPATVLAESVTLPAVLVFVCACLASDAQARFSLPLLGIACCLLVFTRDPMIYFVWLFIGLLVLNILLTNRTRRFVTIAGMGILIVAVGFGCARTVLFTGSGKYMQTLANIVQIRMLPDPERRKYFADRGLPLSPTVLDRSGHQAWVDNAFFEPDDKVSPDFLAYRNWLIANGNRTYATFLLTHPGYLLRSIFHSPNLGNFGGDFPFSIADVFSIPFGGYGGVTAPYPPRLRDFLLAPLGWFIPFAYFAIAAFRYIRRTMQRQQASSVEMVAIAAGAAIFVSYHTDAWDLWRHTLPFVVLVYLSLIVRFPEIVMDLIGWVRQRVASGPSSAAAIPAHD